MRKGTRSTTSLQHRLVQLANRVFAFAGLKVVPLWRNLLPTFRFHGQELPLFCHAYNCGYPPNRMSERSIELAVADQWLGSVDPANVVEIGAVTPYYWPRRVTTVVDPYDTHPGVTSRRSLFEGDFTGRDVLSISTLEHVGSGEYGPGHEESALAALSKIQKESRSFLVTLPYGAREELDRSVFRGEVSGDVDLTFFVRSETGNDWMGLRQPLRSWPRYGDLRSDDRRWANAIAVLESARAGRRHRDAVASCA